MNEGMDFALLHRCGDLLLILLEPSLEVKRLKNFLVFELLPLLYFQELVEALQVSLFDWSDFFSAQFRLVFKLVLSVLVVILDYIKKHLLDVPEFAKFIIFVINLEQLLFRWELAIFSFEAVRFAL